MSDGRRQCRAVLVTKAWPVKADTELSGKGSVWVIEPNTSFLWIAICTHTRMHGPVCPGAG